MDKRHACALEVFAYSADDRDDDSNRSLLLSIWASALAANDWLDLAERYGWVSWRSVVNFF